MWIVLRHSLQIIIERLRLCIHDMNIEPMKCRSGILSPCANIIRFLRLCSRIYQYKMSLSPFQFCQTKIISTWTICKKNLSTCQDSFYILHIYFIPYSSNICFRSSRSAITFCISSLLPSKISLLTKIPPSLFPNNNACGLFRAFHSHNHSINPKV